MPQPPQRAGPRRRAPSYLHVIAVFEEARPSQALDPVGQIESEVCELQAPRAYGRPGRGRASRRNPRRRRPRVGAREATQQRRPVQRLLLRRARRDPINLLEEDFLRRDELLAHGLRRARPAVVKHAGAGRSRAHSPQRRTNAKPLGVLVRPDVLTEPHGADLPSVPMPVRRDRIEVAVEMVVVEEQALDAGLTIPLPYLLAQGRRARLVQDFVRLDVDAPRAAAGGHRAVRLVSQRPAAAARGASTSRRTKSCTRRARRPCTRRYGSGMVRPASRACSSTTTISTATSIRSRRT